MKKRITSFFLVFIIIVGSLLSPAACFADGAGGGYGEIGGGSGTGSYKYRNSRAYVYYDE